MQHQPARIWQATILFTWTIATLFALPLLADSDPPPEQETPPETLAQALVGGDVRIALRYRVESVDDELLALDDSDALASTLRTTLSYRSRAFRGVSLFLEGENVSVVGNEDLYRNAGAGSLSNGVFGRPVVADPAVTEVNQAYVQAVFGETSLRLGRQEINLGNQRFVGTVGWRQNHQSFDAFGIVHKSLPKTTLSYHFLDSVHRIFGDSQDMASHLLHVEFEASARAKLTAYGYLLDYEDPSDVALSTQTVGLRYDGWTDLSWGQLKWILEAAQQEDGGENPNSVDAAYYHAQVGGGIPRFGLEVGFEVLEGSPEKGRFSTPLATLHKFNGWADRFLATPSSGLEDLYLTVRGKVGDVQWRATVHDFSAESRDLDFGSEVDFQATWKSSWKQVFGLKAAFYERGDVSADVTKIMFWTSYGFGP